MAARAYATTKAAIERADEKDGGGMDAYPEGPLTDEVLSNQARIARAKLADRKKKRGK